MTTTPHAPTTWTLAARRHRLVAAIIDGLIFAAVVLPVRALFSTDYEVSDESTLVGYLNPYAGNPYWPIDVSVTVLLAVYFWLQHALWGQTLGKRLWRLKVVSGVTGEPPGFRQAGMRALVYPVLTLVPYLGVLISLVDPLCVFGAKRRCLHDVIAETVVVDLGSPAREKSGGSGSLFGLGVVLILLAVLIIVSALVWM
ncbi:RDD family protein [Streptosporangium sp. NPDC002544]|uniref:RDD family protein n=1 Tax=Streptosporangium sp. NPDC002544 TaxID=3154538 RepID=UPI0033272E47